MNGQARLDSGAKLGDHLAAIPPQLHGTLEHTRSMIFILRLIHVLGGILWVGGAVATAFFVVPAANATGPAGGQVMRELVQVRKLPMFLSLMGPFVLLSGIWLFYIASGGFQSVYMRSGPAMGYSIGATAAIIAAIVGAGFAAPNAKKLGQLGQQIQSAGGPPSPEQAAEMKRLQAKLGTLAKAASGLLIVAATMMAVARYL
jgi:uncharacterized membrane protein